MSDMLQMICAGSLIIALPFTLMILVALFGKAKYESRVNETKADKMKKTTTICPKCGGVNGVHTPRCPTVYIYGHIKN